MIIGKKLPFVNTTKEKITSAELFPKVGTFETEFYYGIHSSGGIVSNFELVGNRDVSSIIDNLNDGQSCHIYKIIDDFFVSFYSPIDYDFLKPTIKKAFVSSLKGVWEYALELELKTLNECQLLENCVNNSMINVVENDEVLKFLTEHKKFGDMYELKENLFSANGVLLSKSGEYRSCLSLHNIESGFRKISFQDSANVMEVFMIERPDINSDRLINEEVKNKQEMENIISEKNIDVYSSNKIFKVEKTYVLKAPDLGTLSTINEVFESQHQRERIPLYQHSISLKNHFVSLFPGNISKNHFYSYIYADDLGKVLENFING